MHYYAIYYVLRAKGWEHNIAMRLAGWSNYVDVNPKTAPWLGKWHAAWEWNWAQSSVMCSLHFWGAHEAGPVQRNPDDLRMIVQRLFRKVNPDALAGSRPEIVARLGIALHAYLDTWAHEHYSPDHRWNDSGTNITINAGGRASMPNIGHADSGEEGTYPDNPYNDENKAIEALKKIYELAPQGRGPVVAWKDVERDMRDAIQVPKHRGDTFDSELTENEKQRGMAMAIYKRFPDTKDCSFSSERPYLERLAKDYFLPAAKAWISGYARRDTENGIDALIEGR
jgi:hypothetical protein